MEYKKKIFYSISFVLWCLFVIIHYVSLCALCEEKNIDKTSETVSLFENKVFGLNYINDPIEKRLNRLEDSIFGKLISNQSCDSRITNLNKALLIFESKIPKSIKDEIEKEVAKELETESNNKSSQIGQVSTTKNVKENVKEFPLLSNLEEFSSQTLKIINQERAFRNLAPLVFNSIAQKISLEHASYLIATKQFSHYGLNGTNPDQRFSNAFGNGKVEELVDGFFADVKNNGEIKPIELSNETSNQLMDAILKVPDKADIVFNSMANEAGISFVLDQKSKQLVVVIEIITNYSNLTNLPQKTSPGSISISGSLANGFKYAWIGIAKKDIDGMTRNEIEASSYFAPIDKVIYVDKTNDTVKSIAKTGGMMLAMVAAPFTYGLSMLLADVLMQSIAQAYQAQDVQIRSGVKADSNGSFSGNVNIGEWGAGIYYISVWAYQGHSKKPIIVNRKTITVD